MQKCLQIVKDWHLTMIVVAMCLVVVIICVTVAIWGQYEAVQVLDFERPESRNVSFNNKAFIALSNPQVLFLAFQYCTTDYRTTYVYNNNMHKVAL